MKIHDNEPKLSGTKASLIVNDELDADAPPQPIPLEVATACVEARGSRDSTLGSVLEGLIHIRTKQDAKWGEQNHPDFFPIYDLQTGKFMREMGPDQRWTYYQLPTEDEAKADCDSDAKRGKLSWGAILKEEVCEAFGTTNEDDLENELLDVLGVTAAWIQAIRRRRERREGK